MRVYIRSGQACSAVRVVRALHRALPRPHAALVPQSLESWSIPSPDRPANANRPLELPPDQVGVANGLPDLVSLASLITQPQARLTVSSPSGEPTGPGTISRSLRRCYLNKAYTMSFLGFVLDFACLEPYVGDHLVCIKKQEALFFLILRFGTMYFAMLDDL